jgi:hypothetical protein
LVSDQGNLGFVLPDEKFIRETFRLVDAADKSGIILRVVGSNAIRIQLPQEMRSRHYEVRKLTDIDFISNSGAPKKKLVKFFIDMGYRPWEHVIRSQLNRHIYENNDGIHVDIFFGRMSMCHTIEYDGRLEAERYTVPLAEILLGKTQIVQISQKDILDVMFLLLSHPIGDTDNDTINARYIAERYMSKDWGFYYTVKTNLERIRDSFVSDPEYGGRFTQEQREIIRIRADQVMDYFERADKSFGWKMRAKVGTRQKWYDDVESFEPVIS